MSEVYTRLLLPKGHGCPIWCPEPDENLPLAYRESGVRIGDVGRIDPDGGFDPLFNICVGADDPINCDGVPDGFKQLVLESGDVKFRSNHHDRGSHICSKPLEKRPNNVDGDPAFEHNVMRSRPAYRFASTATTEGALLLLPEGASRKDVRSRKAQFRQCAIENALHWYLFANERLERDIPNGSLILVTGCDMTSSWGIASFSDVSSDMEVELSFSPSHRGTYLWETNVSATVRTSPGYEPISALNQENGGRPNIWDQSTAEGVRDLITSASGIVDASHGTFNEVGGNQIYHITNNFALATVGDSSHTPRNTYSGPEIGADAPQTSMSSIVAEGTTPVVHSLPERDDIRPKQNQCIFIRGFRISIRDGIFAATFRRRLELSSVSNSTPKEIFGSQSGSSPFSPQTEWTRSWSGGWFGGGDKLQTSRPALNQQKFAAYNSDQFGDKQMHVQDIVLDPILTTSEPYHPFKTIQRYLLDSCPEAIVAVIHDDDLATFMDEHDIIIPEDELLRRLRIKCTPTLDDTDVPSRGVYLQENKGDTTSYTDTSVPFSGASAVLREVASNRLSPALALPLPEAGAYPKEPGNTRSALEKLVLLAGPPHDNSTSTLSLAPSSVVESPSASDSERTSIPSSRAPSRIYSRAPSLSDTPKDRAAPINAATKKEQIQPAPVGASSGPPASTARSRAPFVASVEGSHKFNLKDLLSGGPRLGRKASGSSSTKFDSENGDSKSNAGSTASLSKKYGVCQKLAIGKGATSVVRLAHKWDRTEDKLYAVKEFRKRRKNETEKEYVKKLTAEFCISSTLHHINIVETVDLVQDEAQHWCEVMEFCPGGDLYAAIKKGSMSPSEAECCFKQILTGVSYLHSQGVAHRDIRPENLFFDTKGHLKIGDYGASTVYRLPWETTIHMSTGLCGSELYTAPELFLGKPYDARLVDIWACGIIYYCLHFQELPWRVAQNSDQLYASYASACHAAPTSGSFPPTINHLNPRACRSLMRKMLDPDPKLRSSIEEVLEHTWMQSIEVCYMIANPSHVHVHARSLAERQVEDIFELGTRQIQNPPGRPNT